MTLEELAAIPTVKLEDVKMLWHSGYWDGPLSGIAVYDGKKYWFEIVREIMGGNEDEFYRTRLFALIKLSPEELAYEEENHERFRKYVGHHTDYDEEGKRAVGKVHPQSMHKKFYDNYKPDRNYDNNEIVAFFEN